MAGEKRTPSMAPNFALHRDLLTNNDTLPHATQADGINMKGFNKAVIQVVPDTNVDPTLNILFWSDEASAFVPDHTPLNFAGQGIGVAFDLQVNCHGRDMFVAVTAGMVGAETCKISVAGADPMG